MKILDFGIARLTTPELTDERSLATLTTQTKSGSVLRTVAYMSPEQLRRKSVDHRSDIFSFGTVLYEMLAGHRAFSGETEVDTITAVLREDPPEIRLGRNDVPAAFEQIVHHCLEKEPDNRFQSARDLAFALNTVSDVPSGRRLTFLGWRSWLPRWASLLIAALVAVAAGLLGGAILKPAHGPVYRRLTFERGTIYSARFTRDGRSVVYGASWNGQPLQLYSTLPDSLLARSLELQPAHLLALSRENELAIALHGGIDVVEGTLARPASVRCSSGVAARCSLGGLGSKPAVVHHENGRDAIEYPIGKVLYETNGWIIRFSPKGDEIGFMDHPARWDNAGFVAVADLAGRHRTLTDKWATEDGFPSGVVDSQFSPTKLLWLAMEEIHKRDFSRRDFLVCIVVVPAEKVAVVTGGDLSLHVRHGKRVMAKFRENAWEAGLHTCRQRCSMLSNIHQDP
jgi:eukaryotic-like serine/threonine-protein kinase